VHKWKPISLNSFSLYLHSLFYSREPSSPLSFSKIPKPKSQIETRISLYKIPFFLNPLSLSWIWPNSGKGRRPAGVRCCSPGCSQRRLQPVAVATSCCCCCSLLLPARRGSDGERHTQRGKAGFDDLKRGEALGEGVAFISDFSSISNFNPLIIILVLFMKFLLIVWGESSFDLSIGNGLIVWIWNLLFHCHDLQERFLILGNTIFPSPSHKCLSNWA